MNKAFLLRGAGIFLLAATMLAGCERQNGQDGQDDQDKDSSKPQSVADIANAIAEQPDWSQYLLRHSGTDRPANSTIAVQFARDAIPTAMLDRPAKRVVSIEPRIEADVRFLTPRNLVIDPVSKLESGAHYTVTLHAEELENIPDELGDYSFVVSVIPQDFELTVDGISPDPADRKKFSFGGMIRTADSAEMQQVEKLLQATYRGERQDIEWTHADDDRLHIFVIRDLEKTQTANQLALQWDGAALGVSRSGEQSFDVPALGAFELTSANLQLDRGQQIELRFSEDVDPNQNLSGLVQLGDAPLRFAVEENRILVFPARTLEGRHTLRVSPGIRGSNGASLDETFEREFKFQLEKPQVRFAGEGVILPAGEHLEIPFEAVNVDSVQVTAFQVYADNIGQFLQTNDLDDNRGMERVGRYLWRKTIELPNVQEEEWQRYSIDATDLMREHPGAMFRLTLSINRGNSIYTCSEEENTVPVAPEQPLSNRESAQYSEASGWDGIEQWYNINPGQVSWRDRMNPCKDGYYRYAKETTDARNFLASDLGLLAKRGTEGDLLVSASALRTAEAMAGVELDIRNYQNQQIATAVTDDNGMARIPLDATPFYLIARKNADEGERIGYLKLDRGSALPTSHFDVGGAKLMAGAKGFIYGERGVWRPGDDIHLTFALDDRGNRIPDGHPVTMQLISPRGQVVQTVTNNQPVGNFYRFDLVTSEDAETGNWTAKALLGGASFQRNVKIETIMPNRLKIDLEIPDDILRISAMPMDGEIHSRWLHGAKAPGLKFDIKARLGSRATAFDRFTDFEFDDPARNFNRQEIEIAESRLDAEGNGRFTISMQPSAQPPGMLRATFTTRVFEPGGAFSTSISSAPMHPYKRYVGMKMPEGDSKRNMLQTDTDHIVQIAMLDDQGEPVAARNIQVSLYKVNWKWWWDDSGDNLAQYANANYRSAVSSGTVDTDETGLGQWTLRVNHPAWGRYLLRACDTEGGHCTGRIFYIDWPGWAGRARDQGGAAANVLTIEADKEDYQVGDTATLSLPAMAKGRALLTIENSREVLSARWLELDGKSNTVDVPITAGMAPNVYASITLVQPHADKDNDRPIRLYGVLPLMVEDPSTRLQPRLESADSWQPRESAKIIVSEGNGQAMNYTLAVVDEGLLGLTNFSTPNLHEKFYQREALGVFTWDLYDHVVGAYGGSLERLLALGGGDGGEAVGEQARERRFPPVVKFLGPFELAAGETREHEVTLPQYIGEVRLMLVAGHDGAYGSIDKSVSVREPISLLATLPRVLGPGEEIDIPVSVFSYSEDVQEVEVAIEVGELAEIVGAAKQAVSFDGEQEKIVRFKARTANRAGALRVNVTANGGGHATQAEVNLDIRNPNPPEVRMQSFKVEPGESIEPEIHAHGVPGSNSFMLGVSAVPDFGLEQRLDYLIRYPHGCVEQTTSAAFPQVFLPAVMHLDPAREQEIENNVQAGIERLRMYQNAEGTFSYWPGTSHYYGWADVYAGHFLVEAERKGFNVPQDMRDSWLNAQASAAQRWLDGSGDERRDAGSIQAYRLFVLAMANRADVASMNRLGRNSKLDALSRWMLASAYAQIGLLPEAREQLRLGGSAVSSYRRPGYSFGSALRDRAILLMTNVMIGDAAQSEALATAVGESLTSDRWYSTQSTAFGLAAMARYVSGGDDEPGLKITHGQSASDATSMSAEEAMFQQVLQLDEDLLVEQGKSMYFLRNDTERPLYVNLLARGTPPPGEEQAKRSDLAIELRFHDDEGRAVDPARLEQGRDVIAEVQVTNRFDAEIENLALTHIVPSGWEIANERLGEDGSQASEQPYVYRDIRDDRVLTYFSLKRGESRTFRLRFTASYAGRYYMPGVAVEDMYDADLSARTKGQWTEVIPEADQAE